MSEDLSCIINTSHYFLSKLIHAIDLLSHTGFVTCLQGLTENESRHIANECIMNKLYSSQSLEIFKAAVAHLGCLLVLIELVMLH